MIYCRLGGITPIDWDPDMGCAIFEGTFLARKQIFGSIL